MTTIEKVEWLYQHLDLFGGYMLTFIGNMYRRVQKKGVEAEFSYNETRFIDRAYTRNKKRRQHGKEKSI